MTNGCYREGTSGGGINDHSDWIYTEISRTDESQGIPFGLGCIFDGLADETLLVITDRA